MKQLNGWIKLEGITLKANHGVSEHERKNGSTFSVDLKVKGDLQPAATSDDIHKAINYETLASVVNEEMQIPSNLLEHVANRILTRIIHEMPQVLKVKIRIAKMTPALDISCRASVVKMKLKRS